MVNVLRKYQQPIMIGVTFVIIIAFVVFFQPGNRGPKNLPTNMFQIYGHKYTQEEIDRKGRAMAVARDVGLNELLRGLIGMANTEQEAVSNFIINRFILDHEAQRLGITVSDSEIADGIQKLPILQTKDGTFDPARYQMLEERILRPNGFTEERFNDLVRDQVRVQKLSALLGSTLEVTPAQFRNQYLSFNQKTHLSLIRFDLAEFKAAIQPSEEEITKVFKEREKTYVSPEKRVVSFVQIDLSEAEKAFKDKELLEARQKLANRANDFGQEMSKENASFTEVAKKYGLEVKTTPEFSEEKPPTDLAAVQQAGPAAFKLTDKEPTSDALPFGNGYCILHLEKMTPSRQLTLEEARPEVIEQIKTERANSVLASNGNETRAKIDAALKAGKSFADAAKDAGKKVEEFPVFSLDEPPTDKPGAREIIFKAVEMNDGELSEFLAGPQGGLIIHLDSRDPIDEAKFKKDAETQIQQARKSQSFIAFNEWLRSRRKSANMLQTGPR